MNYGIDYRFMEHVNNVNSSKQVNDGLDYNFMKFVNNEIVSKKEAKELEKLEVELSKKEKIECIIAHVLLAAFFLACLGTITFINLIMMK